MTPVQRSSAGAVPAALHTVEDLLLQLLPLLLSLRLVLSCRLGTARGTRVSAVLCVPQVCVQTARRAQQSLMTAALQHLPLRHEHRERSVTTQHHHPVSFSVDTQAQVLLTQGFQINVTLEHKTSRWGIFVAIAKNTLNGSKLWIFLLCQKSLAY